MPQLAGYSGTPLRELILPHGLVDRKVCAIDATWSGLLFSWRRD